MHELDAAIADIVGDRAIERRVISGHPGRALVNAASEATLVVVGRHGVGSAWQHGLGSVSRHCVIHAAVPTVVVPTDWAHGPTNDIVVGFDGSPNAAAALQWAFRFAGGSAKVRAVIAIEIAPWLRTDLIEERFADELRDEQLRLHDLIDGVDPNGDAEREVAIRGARPALGPCRRDRRPRRARRSRVGAPRHRGAGIGQHLDARRLHEAHRDRSELRSNT